MKKLAAIFTFILAFSLNANAQDHKETPESAKKNTNDLSEFIGLTPAQQSDFYALFEHKYRVLSDPTIPEAQKAEMRKSVGFKISASITPEQKQKLATNPELLERLVN